MARAVAGASTLRIRSSAAWAGTRLACSATTAGGTPEGPSPLVAHRGLAAVKRQGRMRYRGIERANDVFVTHIINTG